MPHLFSRETIKEVLGIQFKDFEEKYLKAAKEKRKKIIHQIGQAHYGPIPKGKLRYNNF